VGAVRRLDRDGTEPGPGGDRGDGRGAGPAHRHAKGAPRRGRSHVAAVGRPGRPPSGQQDPATIAVTNAYRTLRPPPTPPSAASGRHTPWGERACPWPSRGPDGRGTPPPRLPRDPARRP